LFKVDPLLQDAGKQKGNYVNISKIAAAYNKQIMRLIVKKILNKIGCCKKGSLKMHSRF